MQREECIFYLYSADNDNIFTTLNEVLINPTIEDHGKQVFCNATIKDGNGNVLFNQSANSSVFLDIKFPPQPAVNQSLNGMKGQNVTIKFAFKSNPEPSEIKWVITIPSIGIYTVANSVDLLVLSSS